MQSRFSVELFRLGKIPNDASHHRHCYTKISVPRASEKGKKGEGEGRDIILIRNILTLCRFIAYEMSDSENYIIPQNL